jgi:4-oxalocrotonate tautomerase
MSGFSAGLRQKGNKLMSILKLELIEGAFSPSQKQEIISALTDTMLKFEGEAARPTTYVLVSEIKSGDWGRGGVGLTVADVQQVQAGAQPSSSTGGRQASST